METFLNLLWLLLVIASLGVWWRLWLPMRQASAGSREALVGLLALVCALFLLFPVISLTDDLHEIPAISEDVASSRRALQNGKHSDSHCDWGKQAAPAMAAFLPDEVSFASVVIGWLAPLEQPARQSYVAELSPGRAPPASSL